MGSGCGLSMPAQIRIATENTIWAMPECKIGFFPDCALAYHLNNMKGVPKEVGMFLTVLGHYVMGEDAVRYGLATHYIESEKIYAL